MKKLLLLLFTISTLFGNEEGGNYFVDNFLKYSTFYTSVSLESPFAPKQKFSVNTGEGTFQELTEEIEDLKERLKKVETDIAYTQKIYIKDE